MRHQDFMTEWSHCWQIW